MMCFCPPCSEIDSSCQSITCLSHPTPPRHPPAGRTEPSQPSEEVYRGRPLPRSAFLHLCTMLIPKHHFTKHTTGFRGKMCRTGPTGIATVATGRAHRRLSPSVAAVSFRMHRVRNAAAAQRALLARTHCVEAALVRRHLSTSFHSVYSYPSRV